MEANTTSDQKLSIWHQELDRFHTFKTTFLLEGNIYDLHAYPQRIESGVQWNLIKLDRYLFSFLLEKGYQCIVFYDHVDGFSNEFASEHLQQFLEMTAIGGTAVNEAGKYPATLDRATEMIRRSLENKHCPIAVVMNMVSRYVGLPDQLTDEERQCFSRLLLSTLKPRQVRSEKAGSLLNLLFLLCNKVNDIPAWFYIDNPYVKALTLPKPDSQARRRFVNSQIQTFLGYDQWEETELSKYKQQWVDLTEEFTHIELNGLKIFCKQEQLPIHRVMDAVTRFKYGIKDNPWSEITATKLQGAEAFIKNRVKGQEAAIVQTLDTIKRSATGLSGLQHSSRGSKPKGILFFAGPTGTGKTELAKTVAELLFGDEQACIRFDMSEYQQSHSDQKLLGAPPGYVGYEAGGQLTNAVKEKPFSVLLFDEIEKAHPSILDKFLQILEDGRMTDGRGETVYFSESVIIFTSNLGMYVRDEHGNRRKNASPDMSYPELKQCMQQAIKDYFHLELGRPEILNRIGNNIIVFDFIREEIGREIVSAQLAKIAIALKETKQLDVQLTGEASKVLYSHALSNLENGGRGIGNVVELYFLNPLSRFLFDQQITGPCQVTVSGFVQDGGAIRMECE